MVKEIISGYIYTHTLVIGGISKYPLNVHNNPNNKDYLRNLICHNFGADQDFVSQKSISI